MSRKRIDTDSVGEIARRCQLLRQAVLISRGLPNSQAEFCRLMGFHVMTWSGYETKHRISIDSLLKIRQKLGVPTDYILAGGEGGMPNELLRIIHQLEAEDASTAGASA